MNRVINESLTQPFFNIIDYGAASNRRTGNAGAIQAAIDTCSQAGGGTVYVPAGKYVTGSIVLQSNISLFLDAGAVLLGSEDFDDYPIIEDRWEGKEQRAFAPLITGRNLRNIALLGRGTIDGCGASWWKPFREEKLQYARPRLIGFTDCQNVLIEGLTLTNSPAWTINPVRCENVTVDKVTIINPANSPNTDGINPDSCRNVHISNCHVDVGDDCITLKSGIEGLENEDRARLTPCENITISNCTMANGHGGVVFGSEMSGGVKNVVISNCVFTGTERGIRFKSRRGRGGVVENIRVTNIVMEKVLCPFILNLFYSGDGYWESEALFDQNHHPVTESTPRFQRIHFSHITAREVEHTAGFINGLPEMPLNNISFNDISVSMALDAQAGIPVMAPHMAPMQQAGFYANSVQGLRFHNVEISHQNGPALRLIDVADVEIGAFTTPTPSLDTAFIQAKNTNNAFIYNCRASSGTGIFLELEGEHTAEIFLKNNNLSQAQRPVDLAKDVQPDVLVS
ncbi:MAG: glycoside hydrolase family 28 protein [Planctomycetes bacterium]|nr:glycoside hydrolase family 28 protein [Planctomycetota bacterium]